MKVAVVGAGAMGSSLGGLLARAGHQVWLIDTWTEHVDAIRQYGLRLHGPTETLLIRIQATDHVGEAGQCDLVVVMVKAYDTASAVPSIVPLLGPDTVVLTLQNGLGNAENLVAHLGRERVIAGVTYRGGVVLGPGEVRQSGVEKVTIIGELNEPPSERVRTLAMTWEMAGIKTIVSENIVGETWGKLLVNIAGNALGAILRLPLGYLAEVDGARQMVESVLEEGIAVARALDVILPYQDPLQHACGNWRTLRDAKSSLHQDLEGGRRTEIEVLNGAIVREGERLGVPVPYNRAVTLLVKALEARAAVVGGESDGDL